MTTDTLTVQRLAYSCTRCGEWFYHAGPISLTWETVQCPICETGKLAYRGKVGRQGRTVETYQTTPCDEQCTSARGVHCDCKCLGQNHGSRRIITVSKVTGKPTIDLSDGYRLEATKARLLPDIELAEQLRDEIYAREAVLFAKAITARQTGGWIEPRLFTQVAFMYRQFSAVRHAMSLKRPANRVKELRKLAQAQETFAKEISA